MKFNLLKSLMLGSMLSLSSSPSYAYDFHGAYESLKDKIFHADIYGFISKKENSDYYHVKNLSEYELMILNASRNNPEKSPSEILVESLVYFMDNGNEDGLHSYTIANNLIDTLNKNIYLFDGKKLDRQSYLQVLRKFVSEGKGGSDLGQHLREESNGAKREVLGITPSGHFDFKIGNIILRDNIIFLNNTDVNTGQDNHHLMSHGLLPIGKDGKKIKVCRLSENNFGDFYEMTDTEFKKITNILHFSSQTIDGLCFDEKFLRESGYFSKRLRSLTGVTGHWNN